MVVKSKTRKLGEFGKNLRLLVGQRRLEQVPNYDVLYHIEAIRIS